MTCPLYFSSCTSLCALFILVHNRPYLITIADKIKGPAYQIAGTSYTYILTPLSDVVLSFTPSRNKAIALTKG